MWGRPEDGNFSRARRWGHRLLVVDGGAQTLVEVNLRTGTTRTLASDLGFQAPIPGALPSGWSNDVEVDATGALYLNGDRANVIHKLRVPDCGFGFELAFVVPQLAWWHRRRRA